MTNIPSSSSASDAATTPAPHGRRVLLINHHEARLFRADHVGATAETFLSTGTSGVTARDNRSKDFSRGTEKPDVNVFFPPIAAALKGATHIIVFGSGTGASNEMKQFVTWLGTHHADLAKLIHGTVTIDEHHQSDAQTLAKARALFAQPAA